MSKLEEAIFFELPGSSIRGLPIYSNSQLVSIGLVEVSCKPRNKRRQLKDKKQLIYKWWGDNYRKSNPTQDLPTIYRSLAHYDPSINPRLYVKKSELDLVVLYTEITKEMLVSLNDYDKKEIYRIINKNNKQKKLLEEILENKDAKKLHNLITNTRDKPQMDYLRGKMAEILAQKDFEKSIPEGMNCFRNGDIRYFNKRYNNGTEIDAILTFYGEEFFLDLVNNLRKIEHITVRDRWH